MTVSKVDLPDVTVITPSLPERELMLRRAMRSVTLQTVPCYHHIELDVHGEGPAVLRNRALEQVKSKYVAFLDDDDLLDPHHVEVCVAALEDFNMCVAYPWFRFVHPRGWWPKGEFLQMAKGSSERDRVHAFGQQFDPDALRQNNYIPVTVVARTVCLLEAGGFPLPNSEAWPHASNEDWGLWLRLLDAECPCEFVHVPQVTWEYRVHGGNTGGKG